MVITADVSRISALVETDPSAELSVLVSKSQNPGVSMPQLDTGCFVG